MYHHLLLSMWGLQKVNKNQSSAQSIHFHYVPCHENRTRFQQLQWHTLRLPSLPFFRSLISSKWRSPEQQSGHKGDDSDVIFSFPRLIDDGCIKYSILTLFFRRPIANRSCRLLGVKMVSSLKWSSIIRKPKGSVKIAWLRYNVYCWFEAWWSVFSAHNYC